MKISGISAARRRIPPALRLRCREATAREGHCGGAVGFVLEVVAGGEVESCEGEVVAARDWHGACLPGSAFWKQGRGSPLAREIPDIFRAALFQDQGQPRGKFRNDDVVFFLAVAPVSEGNSFTPSGETARGDFGLGDSFTHSGVVRHACRHRVTARGVFVFCFGGILSHALDRQHEGVRFLRRREGAGNSGMTTVWVLLRFILTAVAGACVGRRTGQARMPPVDRQHEGFKFLRPRPRFWVSPARLLP